MNNATERRKGFDSPFKTTYEYGWELKNTGYDYSEMLADNTLSNYMFRNTRLATFLRNHFNKIMVFYINKVKHLRIYYNYAVPKDYEKIN